MVFSFLIVILFQVYCFYHIYKNKDKAYWYIVIILFPMIGGFIYFITKALGPVGLGSMSEVQEAKPNLGNIDELEQQVDLSDTVSNKIRLADAYVANENYKRAIEIYESCFNQFTEDDEELNEKLLAAYYFNQDYVNTIAFGKKLEQYKFFDNSKEKTYYAWSYFELNDDEMAEKIFLEMNIENTNFYHRKEYAKFLMEVDRHDEGKIILEDIVNEIKDMDPYERRSLKEITSEVKVIMNQI